MRAPKPIERETRKQWQRNRAPAHAAKIEMPIRSRQSRRRDERDPGRVFATGQRAHEREKRGDGQHADKRGGDSQCPSRRAKQRDRERVRVNEKRFASTVAFEENRQARAPQNAERIETAERFVVIQTGRKRIERYDAQCCRDK